MYHNVSNRVQEKRINVNASVQNNQLKLYLMIYLLIF